MQYSFNLFLSCSTTSSHLVSSHYSSVWEGACVFSPFKQNRRLCLFEHHSCTSWQAFDFKEGSEFVGLKGLKNFKVIIEANSVCAHFPFCPPLYFQNLACQCSGCCLMLFQQETWISGQDPGHRGGLMARGISNGIWSPSFLGHWFE